MKTIYSFIILVFFISMPAFASHNSKDIKPGDIHDAYKIVVQCQAGMKILAYYVDIYRTMNTFIDKNELAPGSAQVAEKLKADWKTLEELSIPLKVALIRRGINTDFLDNDFYKKQQADILAKGVVTKSIAHLTNLMEFVNECNDVKQKVQDLNKKLEED